MRPWVVTGRESGASLSRDGEFDTHCNIAGTNAADCADVLRQRQRHGRGTHVGLSRLAFPHVHSAKANGPRSVDRECQLFHSLTSSLIEAGIGAVLRVSGGTIGAGAIVETLTNGTAIVSGTVTNGGTLFASAAGSLVEIASGAVVNGGVALIGDGVVDIAGSSGESVKFLSNGSGALELDGLWSAYRGKVSGFGGSSHSNHDQFIDFTEVGSGATVSYTSAASHASGTLMVTSGGVSATVTLVGTYSSANFSSGTVGGHVRVTDPGIVGGGSVEASVSDITFGAHTTLAYSEKSNAPGLGATEGRYAAALALLGHYMAGSFVTATGHGGTPVTQAPTEQQPLLTLPWHR
jgi:filamentous hemagglutinin